MPELPEVRIVSRQLNHLIQKRTIKAVTILKPKLIKELDEKLFREALVGQKITKVTNYGKFIIYHFTTSLIMLSHMRMEGKYAFYKTTTKPAKHDHIIFYFEDHSELHYNDTRVFGTFHLRTQSNYLTTLPLAKMAQEPALLNPLLLYKKLQQKRVAIKTALLDQTLIVGLGNIYVDEVLFATRIMPLRPAKSLSKNEVANVVQFAISIMDRSTLLGGSSIQSYSSLNQQEGQYQNFLQVHTKRNQPCPSCATLIQKIKVNGRGTYYCPTCQH